MRTAKSFSLLGLQRIRCITAAASFVLASVSLDAAAMPIFFDDFDAESGMGNGLSGQSEINYTTFANWTVSDGTVDLVNQGDFGPIDCVGGAGKCVDLDGTSSNAGVMTSIDIVLDPGTYELAVMLSGVSSTFPLSPASSAPNEVTIAVGGIVSFNAIHDKGDPFSTFGGQFDILTTTTVNIVIENAGGDDFGAILDDVSLAPVPTTSVPLPGTLVMLLSGIVALRAGGRGTRRS